MRSRFAIAALLLALPLFAHAEEWTEWSFLNGKAPGRWEVKGLTSADGTQDGLRIVTTAEGYMIRKEELPHTTDVVIVHATAARPTDAILLWHRRGDGPDDIVQLPFVISPRPIAGAKSQNGDAIKLDVSFYDQWDRRADMLGIALPAGSNVLLAKIELLGWSPTEKIVEAWKSFWTLDEFQAYSINFLWGPLLTFNTVARENLFATLPPKGWSANRIFYTVILIAAAGGVALWLRKGRTAEARRSALAIVAGVFVALWLVFDLRMGHEILSYAKSDYVKHVRKPVGERTLRYREDFYDAFDRSMPAIAESPHFGVISPWPVMGLVRYLGYPSVPVLPGEPAAADVRVWWVYGEPKATVDDRGRLLLNGAAVAGTGSIIERFRANAFLFRVGS